MSTRTQDRFNMESTVVPGGGRVDRSEENEREASSPESFASSSNPPFNSQAKAAQPSHDTRVPAHHRGHLEHQLATDVARSPLCRILNTKAIRKLLDFVAGLQTRFHAAIPDAADKPEDERGIDIFLDPFQQELSHGGPYIGSARKGNDLEGNTLPPHALPQMLATIESDGQSRSSGESDRGNDYWSMLKAEVCEGVVGQPPELIALYDTGSPGDFIYRDILDGLGKIKELPLPPEQVKAYQGALDRDDKEKTVPKSFVRLRLWNEQIGLNAKVQPRILEASTGSGGVHIILGRPFIAKNGGTDLLRRVEANSRTQTFRPNLERVAALRRIKTSKTKKREAINDARDQEQREEDQRLHTETHGWETSLTVPIPPTAQLQSTSNSIPHPFYPPTTPSYPYRDHIRPQIAYPYAGSAVQQAYQGSVAPLPDSSAGSQDGPHYGDATMQPTAESSVNPTPDHPADWQSQRTDTWQSQSTTTSSAQFTRSSRQSTASSMSTAPSLGSVRMPAKGERFAAGRQTPQGGVHRESTE